VRVVRIVRIVRGQLPKVAARFLRARIKKDRNEGE
jgi:hypothetical protein